MAEVWTEQIIFARYHLSVCERLLSFYAESPEKRFFIGALNELARAATKVINAVLMQAEGDGRIKINQNPGKNLMSFRNVSGDYLKNPKFIFEIMRIKTDHKKSPVHFDRGGEVLFLVKGKYKALTLGKLNELVEKFRKELGELKVI
jgi:hypothetical protein